MHDHQHGHCRRVPRPATNMYIDIPLERATVNILISISREARATINIINIALLRGLGIHVVHAEHPIEYHSLYTYYPSVYCLSVIYPFPSIKRVPLASANGDDLLPQFSVPFSLASLPCPAIYLNVAKNSSHEGCQNYW